MTRTRWTLRDWEAGTLDHRSLYRFVMGLGVDSALYRARSGCGDKAAAWLDGSAECALIADLIDTVKGAAVALGYKGTGRRPPEIEPYPRPWGDQGRGTRYGRGAVPIGDFNEWYYGGE